MKAMVLAAGLGTRLRPLTYELPKPMVPVLDRPVMAHIVDLLDRHGFDEVIANLHYFPDTIRDYFGDRLDLPLRGAELLGTAGGVRNVRDFFGDEPFLIISGDALTDIDLSAFVARHKAAGGIATLAVKRVDGHARVRRRAPRRRRPHHRLPGEAATRPRRCRTSATAASTCSSRRSSTTSPSGRSSTGRNDVFPALLEQRRAVPHPRDRRVLERRRLARRAAGRAPSTRCAASCSVELRGEEIAEGVRIGEGTELTDATLIEPPVWIGRDVRIGAGVRLRARS